MLNNVKKLLIIQKDDAYFLFETLQVLEKCKEALNEFSCQILVSPESLNKLQGSVPLFNNQILTSDLEVLNQEYDLSVNLSLREDTWDLHGKVKSKGKIGCFLREGQLCVPDLWSSFYLTIKAQAPFLTFHLQDIYKNILGIKQIAASEDQDWHFNTIAFGFSASRLMKADEQENFIKLISTQFPHIDIKEVSEIDLISDLSHTLYIGPNTLDALKLCENGAHGIFLTSHFQGLNLMPSTAGHLVVSSRGLEIKSSDLFKTISEEILQKDLTLQEKYSYYRIEQEHLFGPYLKSLNASDANYPFYQSHVVLWNYVLNLYDTNLDIIKCSPDQLHLLEFNGYTLSKLIRLYDYAMSSIDTIHFESKNSVANLDIVRGHLHNLREIDEISDKISHSHPLLRPFLDFYKIRRGQNEGSTLFEQSQNSFLTYSEEHQVLKALHELFSVTLRKNEVSI